jgi:hypothetical protein
VKAVRLFRLVVRGFGLGSGNRHGLLLPGRLYRSGRVDRLLL